MNINQNKKGMEQLWWIIIVAAIAILVMILLVLWFRGSGQKGFGVIDQNIEGLEDCDEDRTADIFDDCVCDAGDNDGCPAGEEAQLTILKAKKKTDCNC